MLGLLRLGLSIELGASPGALRLRAGVAAGGALLRAGRRPGQRAAGAAALAARLELVRRPGALQLRALAAARPGVAGDRRPRRRVGRARSRRWRWRCRPWSVFSGARGDLRGPAARDRHPDCFSGRRSRASIRRAPAPAARLRAAGPVALALLPSLLLAAASWRGGVTAPAPFEPTVSSWEMYDFPVGDRRVLRRVRHALSPDRSGGAGAAAAGADRRAAAGPPGRRNSRAPRWPLHAAGILALLYLLFPHIVLGSDLTPRLRPLLVFRSSVTAASRSRPSPGAAWRCWPWPRASGGAALLAEDFRSLGRALDDFSSGIPFVRRGSRVYPVIFDPRSPSILVKPFLHAWGYYGLARDVVTPYAFAWHADAISLPLPRAASASSPTRPFPRTPRTSPTRSSKGVSARRSGASRRRSPATRFAPSPRRGS